MLVFLGLGKFFGSNIAGRIAEWNAIEGETATYDWSGVFNTTGVITAVVTVLFVLTFHDKQKYDLDKTG